MKSIATQVKTLLLLGGLLALPAAAQAQLARFNQAQYLNNVMGAARLQQFAPFANGFGGFPGYGGFNPFFGGGFVNPYTPAFGGGFSNPYSTGGFGSNPYTLGGGGGYGGGGMGYGGYSLYPASFGPGYFLQGASSVMKAYGSVVTADQQARIMAEQASQAHIETLKKRFEYDAFVKANTIPYSEVQAKIHKSTLNRIRSMANSSEVSSGKSLNMLLRDLEGVQGKKITIEPIPISEEVLKHLNVTTGHGNLGLLRNDGRFTWPPALIDLVPAKEREEIELQSQALVQKAIDGKVPGNVLRDLGTTMENIGDKLSKKVNEIPSTQYLAAQRFLRDFASARLAMEEPGNAVAYFNFQKWATGGKTIQELTDYMLRNGLKFAPAVQGDENAYHAAHSAMATYDTGYNNQVASSSPPVGKE